MRHSPRARWLRAMASASRATPRLPSGHVQDFSSSSAPVARLTSPPSCAGSPRGRPLETCTRTPDGGAVEPFRRGITTDLGAEDNVFRVYDVPARIPGPGRQRNLGNEPRRERAGFATSAEFRIRQRRLDERRRLSGRMRCGRRCAFARASPRGTSRGCPRCARTTRARVCSPARASPSPCTRGALDVQFHASDGLSNHMDEPMDFNAVCFSGRVAGLRGRRFRRDSILGPRAAGVPRLPRVRDGLSPNAGAGEGAGEGEASSVPRAHNAAAAFAAWRRRWRARRRAARRRRRSSPPAPSAARSVCSTRTRARR